MSNLRFVWPPTCLNLDRLAWVCIDFRLAQISTQVDAGFSSFVYPTQVDTKPFAYAWNLRLLATCMKLRADLRIRLATLASPYTSSWANFCRAWETCQENLVWLQRRRKHKQARLELETPEQSELRSTKTATSRTKDKKDSLAKTSSESTRTWAKTSKACTRDPCSLVRITLLQRMGKFE